MMASAIPVGGCAFPENPADDHQVRIRGGYSLISLQGQVVNQTISLEELLPVTSLENQIEPLPALGFSLGSNQTIWIPTIRHNIPSISSHQYGVIARLG